MSAPNGSAQDATPAAVPVRWSRRFFVVWLVLLVVSLGFALYGARTDVFHGGS